MSRRISTTEKEKRLMVCAERGSLDEAKDLIMNGVNMDCKNEVGNAPLHIAAVNGMTEMVNLFVAAGSNIAILNHDHETPIQMLQKSFVSTDPRRGKMEKLLRKRSRDDSSQVIPRLVETQIGAAPTDLAWARRLGEMAHAFFTGVVSNTHNPAQRTPVSIIHPVPDPAAFDTASRSAPALVPAITAASVQVTQPGPSIAQVPDDNWLAPFLRLAGMTNAHIVQECCEIIVGAFEFTKDGLASLTTEEFKEQVLPNTNITVPGRLATLRRAHQLLRAEIKVAEQNLRRQLYQQNYLACCRAPGNLSDQLSDLSIDAPPPLRTVSPEEAHHSRAIAGDLQRKRGNSVQHSRISSGTSLSATSVHSSFVSRTPTNASRPAEIATPSSICVTPSVSSAGHASLVPTATSTGADDKSSPRALLAEDRGMALAPLPLLNSRSSANSVRRRALSPQQHANLALQEAEHSGGAVMEHHTEEDGVAQKRRRMERE